MKECETFGERLKDLMIEESVLVETIAQKAKIDISVVYKYKRNETLPSLETAIKMAEILNCNLDYFFRVSDEKSKFGKYDVKNFSIRFKELLKQKNYTRYRLKKETTLAKQTIEDWYSGKRIPTAENLILLVKHLNGSIDQLLGYNEIKK